MINHEEYLIRTLNLKTLLKKSNFCDYGNAYIHVDLTIPVPKKAAAAASVNNTNITIILKNCALLPNCVSETNNIQVADAQDIDIVMPIYNLGEYSDVYLKMLLEQKVR